MTIQTLTKPKIVFENGEPSEVILRWKDFQEILEKIEDMRDLAEIKRIKAKKPRFKDFESVLKNYGL